MVQSWLLDARLNFHFYVAVRNMERDAPVRAVQLQLYPVKLTNTALVAHPE